MINVGFNNSIGSLIMNFCSHKSWSLDLWVFRRFSYFLSCECYKNNKPYVANNVWIPSTHPIMQFVDSSHSAMIYVLAKAEATPMIKMIQYHLNFVSYIQSNITNNITQLTDLTDNDIQILKDLLHRLLQLTEQMCRSCRGCNSKQCINAAKRQKQTRAE